MKERTALGHEIALTEAAQNDNTLATLAALRQGATGLKSQSQVLADK